MPLAYEQRLKTYTAWRHSSPSKEAMAAAGFIFIGKSYAYDGQDDAVKCLDCDLQLGQWYKEHIPFGEHAKYKPECLFIIAQQAAARSAKAVASANIGELNDFWKQKVRILERSRKDAAAMLAAEKDAHAKTRQDSLFWISKAETAKAATANVRVERDALVAAHATKIYELNAVLDTWKSMITQLRTAPADKVDGLDTTHISEISEMKAEVKALATALTPIQAAIVDNEAARTTELDQLRIQTDALTQLIAPLQAAVNHRNVGEVAQAAEVEQLETDLKALTTSISPLQAAIEALTGAIIHLQPDNLPTGHGLSSEVDGNDHVEHGTVNQGPIAYDDSSSWTEASSEPGDTFVSEDMARDVARYAGCEKDINPDHEDAIGDEAEKNFVTPGSWENSSDGVSKGNGTWSLHLDEEDNGNVGANDDSGISVKADGGSYDSLSGLEEVHGGSAADESANDENTKSEDAWSDLERSSTSIHGHVETLGPGRISVYFPYVVEERTG